MKKFLAVLLAGISAAQAQVPTINSGTSGVTAPTGTTTIRQMWDDGHAVVPLQFGFPYFGKTFTNSVMYDNGVVGFFSPATQTTQQVGCDPAVNGYCGGNNWYSQPFTTTLGPSWNYTIAPLHTDMRPVTGSVYSTTGDATQMTYRWQNVGEYYNPSNLNTFSLQIKPSGFIGVDYEKVNLGQSNVSVGLTGDLSKGEFAQHFWKPAGNIVNSIPNWNVNGTGVDQCVVNPLSSPTCSGYTEAMCVSNPLYSTTCIGYQQAFFSQQCTANPLYNVNCPGYANAYLSYQCSIDPLYSTTCDGYATAYHDQQCSINPLYATDCQGYANAYFEQQCSINPLYSTTCSGYTAAYKTQQCNLNPLYATDCSGYQQAYFNQQCTANPLYDKTCPGYAEAYALKFVVVTTPTTPTTPTVTESVAPTPATDSGGEIKVAVVADSNVNNVIQTTATSASPAQAATATVPLVTTTPATTAATELKASVTTSSNTEDKKDASSSSVSASSTTQTTSGTETKSDAKPTARQELQARREAAAKAAAVEAGKNLAGKMGEASSMEAQVQVQNVVVQAMGFTPGFDAYGKVFIPQTVGYKPYSVYNNQVNVDNRKLGRGLFGPTDNLHKDMVDSQYKGN